MRLRIRDQTEQLLAIGLIDIRNAGINCQCSCAPSQGGAPPDFGAMRTERMRCRKIFDGFTLLTRAANDASFKSHTYTEASGLELREHRGTNPA